MVIKRCNRTPFVRNFTQRSQNNLKSENILAVDYDDRVKEQTKKKKETDKYIFFSLSFCHLCACVSSIRMCVGFSVSDSHFSFGCYFCHKCCCSLDFTFFCFVHMEVFNYTVWINVHTAIWHGLAGCRMHTTETNPNEWKNVCAHKNLKCYETRH